MPLTSLQTRVLAALADGRGRDSYLAGGAALHLGAAGERYSAENLPREPGALFVDARTGAFFLPRTPEDWAHTREHRGALGGVVPQLAGVPLSALGGHGGLVVDG